MRQVADLSLVSSRAAPVGRLEVTEAREGQQAYYVFVLMVYVVLISDSKLIVVVVVIQY